MITTKVITTIDFTAKTLTVVEGASILSDEELIFKIINPTGTTIYINDGFSTTDFSSPDIEQGESSELVVDMPTDSDDVILQGTYTLYYLSSKGKRHGGTITVRYCITEPTVDVSLEYSCRSAELTSTDNSEYNVYCPCSASDITPSITRTHTVSYPTTMETPIPDIVDTGATITTPDLWTKLWVSKISSALVYKMPSAAYTGDTTYRVTGTVTGISEATVVCDSCLCLLYECISSVISKWLSIKETASPSDLEKYETVLFELLVLHMQYSMSEGCETEADTRAICGRMQTILNAWDCECDITANSSYSVEVVPVIGSGSSTSVGGTIIYNGDGVPSVSVGNNGDFYFNNLTGGVFKKITGVWVLQFTMVINALLSNHLIASDNTSVSTHSDVYTELKSIEFDVTDVQDGSVLVLSANLGFYEPTGDDTAIRLNVVGTSTDSTTIPVNADFDGNRFSLTLEAEFYIMDLVGTLTVIGVMYKLYGSAGIVAYGYEQLNVNLNATLTPNEVNLLAKSDDNITDIYLNNIKLNHLRTV